MKRNLCTLAISAMLLALTSPAFASGPTGANPPPPTSTTTTTDSTSLISYLASLLGL